MKKSFIFLFLLFSLASANLFAQEGADPEVGVVEHLGSTLPLDLTFQNEKSEKVTLGQVIDKPTILSFVYFDCPGLCSPLLEGIGDVIKKSDMVLGKDYQVVTISFNFRDTPEKAKIKKDKFVEKYSKGNGNGWIFLTTDSVSIFKITDATGFKTKAVGLDFMHPSAIIAISPNGKITRYLYGINFLPIDVKMSMVEAGKDQTGPSIKKLMLVCFSYDEDSKKFGLDVMKVGGILIIFLLFILAIILFVKPKLNKNKKP